MHRSLLDTGIVDKPGDRPELVIDTPAGMVTATAERVDGRVAEVAFRNVPSFGTHLGESVFVDGVGEVGFDVAFGGAFYAFVDETSLPVDRDDVGALVDAAGRIKKAVAESVPIEHPDHADLGFLYLVGSSVGSAVPTPGGVGGVEAALIAVLTGAGVDSASAAAAVVVFRLVTYWLPVPFGYLCLRYSRSAELV